MIGSELPKGWKLTKLGDILCRMTNGLNIEQTDVCSIDSFPISRIETIANEKIDFSRVKYCTPSIDQKQKYLLKDGDILFSHINSDKHLGKTAIYKDIEPLMHVVNLLLLRCNSELYNSGMLNYLLRYYRYIGVFMGIAQRAVNQSSINQKKLSNLDIPLPPLTEQKQIAEKLDKLFDQIETIKEASNKIPELLKNFRQQVLTYAVTGKLTEEWRNNNNVNLIRIIDQLKEQRINEVSSKVLKEKLEKIYIDNNSSIDFPIPEQWIPINLDKICESFSYGTSSKSMNEGTYPVLRMGNIQNGKLIWSDLKYTSDESEYIKYQLNVGDVLFNRTNSPELVGKTAIYDEDKKACYAGYIIRIDPYREYVNPYYLNIVLNSQYAKRWCWEHKSDGVSQSNINAQKLSKFTIPYPHIAEQNIIVERVQSLFAKLDAIEDKYNIMLENLGKLPQALLCKAFEGEMFTK